MFVNWLVMARVSCCAKRSADQNDTVVDALNQAKRGIAMDMLLQQWEGFLNGVQPGKFYSLT